MTALAVILVCLAIALPLHGQTVPNPDEDHGLQIQRAICQTNAHDYIKNQWTMRVIEGGAHFSHDVLPVDPMDFDRVYRIRIDFRIYTNEIPLADFSGVLSKFVDWARIAEANGVTVIEKPLATLKAYPLPREYTFTVQNRSASLDSDGGRMGTNDAVQFLRLIRDYPALRRDFDAAVIKMRSQDSLFK
jgi:hypothetical protein